MNDQDSQEKLITFTIGHSNHSADRWQAAAGVKYGGQAAQAWAQFDYHES